MQLYTKILIGMAVGVVLGFLVGPNSSLLPADGVQISPKAEILLEPEGATMDEAQGLRLAKIVEEQPGDPSWLKISWRYTAPEVLKLQSQGVKAKAGETYEGWVKNSAPEVRRFAPIGKNLVKYTEWIGRLFLALIKMVVVPLVFFSLLVGVASLGDFRALGRLGSRTLGYFMGTTVFALVIGVGLTNLVKPGKLLSESDRTQLLASYQGSVGDTVANAANAPKLC